MSSSHQTQETICSGFCNSQADSESLVPSDEQECIYENKLTPLHFWEARGHLAGVRLLLAQEVDVDRPTACGYTPLLFTLQDKQAPGAPCRRQPGG